MKLAIVARRKAANGWPGAIAPYLLGKLSEDHYLGIALASAQPTITKRPGDQAASGAGQLSILEARHMGPARFYQAVMALQRNDVAAAQAALAACTVAGKVYPELEYYLGVVLDRKGQLFDV